MVHFRLLYGWWYSSPCFCAKACAQRRLLSKHRYVQVAIPTPFDKTAHNGLEEYTWNEKKQRVDVKYTFNDGSFTGKQTVVYQKGRVNSKVAVCWRVFGSAFCRVVCSGFQHAAIFREVLAVCNTRFGIILPIHCLRSRAAHCHKHNKTLRQHTNNTPQQHTATHSYSGKG